MQQPLSELCVARILQVSYTGRVYVRVHRKKSISPEVQLFYAETERC